MAVKVGSFTKSTNTGVPVSQAITGVGFQPKALILWTAGTTADDTFQNNARFAIGITTGASASGSMAGASQDNVNPSNTSQRVAEKALTIVEWGESLVAECDLTSFDAGGFTLSWTTNNATAYIINYMAIGGDEITNAKFLSWEGPNLFTTGNYAVSGVGFTPDVVFHLASGVTGALPATAVDCVVGIGAMSAASQWLFCSTDRDNLTDNQTKHVGSSTECLRSLSPNTSAGNRYAATYTSMDADGFTVNFSLANLKARFFSLCLEGTALKVGSFQKGAGSGGYAVDGLGFIPNGVMFAGVSKNDTATAAVIDARLSLGAMTNAAERAAHWQSEHLGNTVATNVNAYSGNAVVYDDPESDASLSNTVTYTSMDADGFTVNFSAASSGLFYGWLAIGGAAEDDGGLQASGHNITSGSATFTGLVVLEADGHNATEGAGRLTPIYAGATHITQAGALIDVQAEVPAQVTQAGAQIDVQATVPVQTTQAGAQIDVQATVPVQTTQAGALIDVQRTVPVRMTAAGVLLDGLFTRPQTVLNCWEFHVYDRGGNYLAYLDNAFDKSYLTQLRDVGGGSFKMPSGDPKATAVNLRTSNIVKVRYRNVDVGIWQIENVVTTYVDTGEGAAQILSVSGRGLLGSMHKAIVYPVDIDDPLTTTRVFEAKTKAAIFLQLYEEYVARGGGLFSISFTPTHDSNNQLWTDSVSLEFKAGQNLLDVLHQLQGFGLEVAVRPDKTLNALASVGQDVSGAVAFRHGQNMLSCSVTSQGSDLSNVVLAEGKSVLLEEQLADSIALYGRSEAYLPVRNTDSATVLDDATGLFLDTYGTPPEAITLAVNSAPDWPLIDYNIGDRVYISVPGAIDADYRILAVAIQEGSGPCDLRVDLELNSLRAEYLARLQRAMDASLASLSPGTGVASGMASSSTPLDGDVTALEGRVDGLEALAHAALTLASDADTLLGLTGQQLTLDSQAANRVLAGPASGADADPTFRALAAADLGTGTPDGTLFLRDDLSWAQPRQQLAVRLASVAGTQDVNSTSYMTADWLSLRADFDHIGYTAFRILVFGNSSETGQTITCQLALNGSLATGLSAAGDDLVIGYNGGTAQLNDSGWVELDDPGALGANDDLRLALVGSNATVDLIYVFVEVQLKA